MTMDYRYTPNEIGELNVIIDELRAEVERLQADKIKLAEENLQLRQIVDGYMRAAWSPSHDVDQREMS